MKKYYILMVAFIGWFGSSQDTFSTDAEWTSERAIGNHPSGIYFVKMISSDFTLTQKLILLN